MTAQGSHCVYADFFTRTSDLGTASASDSSLLMYAKESRVHVSCELLLAAKTHKRPKKRLFSEA